MKTFEIDRDDNFIFYQTKYPIKSYATTSGYYIDSTTGETVVSMLRFTKVMKITMSLLNLVKIARGLEMNNSKFIQDLQKSKFFNLLYPKESMQKP